MKILAIAGSPRPKGNSNTLLNRFIQGAREAGAEVELVRPFRMKIAPCIGCEKCRENEGRCTVKDDFQTVYDQVIASDALVFATPTYFSSVSAQMKTFIDRCQSFWALTYVLKRPMPPGPAGSHTRKVALISVSGQNKPEMFDGMQLIFNNIIGTLQAEKWGELLVPGVDLLGDVLKRPDALEKAYELGRRLALGMSADE